MKKLEEKQTIAKQFTQFTLPMNIARLVVLLALEIY